MRERDWTSGVKICRHIAPLAAAAFFFLAAHASASAHAELRRATPAAGGTVAAAPTAVVLNFSEALEGAFSSVIVRDATGKRVDKADAHVDPADRTAVRVSLQPLGNGTYTVEWRAVTADTHRTKGTFSFRVGESH